MKRPEVEIVHIPRSEWPKKIQEAFSGRQYSVSGDSLQLLEERDNLRHALKVMTKDSLELVDRYNALLDVLSQKTAEIHCLRDELRNMKAMAMSRVEFPR